MNRVMDPPVPTKPRRPRPCRPGSGRRRGGADRRSKIGLLWGCLCATASLSAWAASPWPSEAVARFQAVVVERPSDRQAGVLATLPDGGVLPRPPAGWWVEDSEGRELASVCVWHNPEEGMGIVFEPPADNRPVTISIGGMPRAPTPEKTQLKPSLLLYTSVGNASLEGAQAMASDVPPGRQARMGLVRFIGHRQNPFGPDDDYQSWYSGWLRVTTGGPIRFSTISDEGSIFKIDGKTVAQWPGIHTRDAGRKGEFGSSVSLSPGLYRVDYFHFEASGDQEAQACWRTPESRPDSLPVMIPDHAFLHTGRAELRSAETRDGAVPALWTWNTVSYLWFGEKPANLYRLRALFVPTNNAAVSCEWQLGSLFTVREAEFLWIVEGDEALPVTLTVKTGRLTSRSTRRIEMDTTPARASVENAQHRLAYRRALLTRCEAVPAGQRPCATWSPGLWTLLLQVLEPYRGLPLLKAVFERSRPEVLSLAPSDRRRLEELYFEGLRYTDREATLRWLERFEKEEKEPARKAFWKGRAVEFYLYDVEDTNTARRLAQALQASGEPHAALLGTIRMGDIERLAGHAEEARRLYARAQDMPVSIAPAGAGEADPEREGRTLERRGPRTGGRSARSGGRSSGGDGLLAVGGKPTDPWKAEAVRASSYYRSAHDLIEKGAYAEARDVLSAWEQELPLSKLDGDYSLAEAEYFKAIRDLRRALKILSAYRQSVEMSAFLPEIMEMEVECCMELGRTAVVRDLADRMERLFPGHPAARKARSLADVAASGGATGGGTTAAGPTSAPDGL